MKKITYLLIAAMSLVSVASCVKELTPEPFVTGDGIAREFTVTLPPATRTDLVEGKTVWAKGDSLWVSNGVTSESVVVPEEYWGQKEFKFIVKNATFSDTTKTIYVVYPYAAAGGLTDGKVKVVIPGVQEGLFATANIAAAVSEDYNVSLKNVTSVLKVTVPEGTKAAIYSLAVSATNGNPLTGTCTVDFSGDAPVLIPPTKPGSDISVQVDGLTGDFFLATIPGTYDAGFTLMAATTDFANAVETKQTTVANTVKVNDLVDLGTIGTDLQPLSGEGTAASPYLLESIGHVIAFASAVSDGNTFAGEYFKLGNDIAGITTPIGNLAVSYSNSAYTLSGTAFQGHFDGGNHTMTINLTAATAGRTVRVGLFGGIGDGAVIENLVIDGSVSVGGGNFIGALAGMLFADAEGVTVRNVTNKASVGGNNHVGGLVGEVDANVKDMVTFENCVNEGDVICSSYGIGGIIGWMANKNVMKTVTACTNKGAVKGIYQVGGIFGYGYYATAKECVNEGLVTATQACGGVYGLVGGSLKFQSSDYNRGVGGIGGWNQNGYYIDCVNKGDVTGVTKVGGIGGANYWTHTTNCKNSGTITGTGAHELSPFTNQSITGGIVGWAVTQGNITGCENTGAVKGNGCVGGVVGRVDTGGTSGGYQVNVRTSKNSGKVNGNGMAVGGIAGLASSMANNRYAVIQDCENSGDVTNASQQTGGVVGNLYDLNNSAMGRVLNCSNSGAVQGTIWTGGVIGYAQGRATKSACYVRNCANSGNVTGTRADADNGEVVGGLVGAANNVSAGLGLQMFNCINTGNVRYKVATHEKPYVGGIIGNFQKGKIENVVSMGTVGPLEGSPAEAADNYMGTFAGNIANDASLKYAYCPPEVFFQATGKAGVQLDPATAFFRTYSEWGELSDLVTIKGTDSFIVDEALNLWVSANTDYAYYTWTWADKPEFAKE